MLTKMSDIIIESLCHDELVRLKEVHDKNIEKG